jgi:hypothetical protein
VKFVTKTAIQTEAWTNKVLLNKEVQSGFYPSSMSEKTHYWAQADVDYYNKLCAIEERINNLKEQVMQERDAKVADAIQELLLETA